VQRGEEKKGGYLLVALPLLYNMSSLRGFWASADFLQWTDDRKNERSEKRGGEQKVSGGEKERRGIRIGVRSAKARVGTSHRNDEISYNAELSNTM
jgi:hypothetical protein